MNSRERVLTALEHREPDRVPIVFGGLQTSIQTDAHRALKEHLKLQGGSEDIVDWVQYIVDPDPRLKERFQNDVISIYPHAGSGWRLEIDPKIDAWIDEWGITYQRPSGGYWYDFAGHPLKQGTHKELKHYSWPDPRDPARFQGLAEHAKRLFEHSGKAVMVHSRTGGIFEQSWFLRGFENLLLDMHTNVRYVEALADRILEWMIAFWDEMLRAVGPYVQVVALADDLGHQSGLLFAPDLYRRIYKPRHRQLIDFIRAKTEARIWFHSCGSIYRLLPDLIEVGVEIINPVQVSAKDMDSARLKREFGRDLCFWGGGCDPQAVLPRGSVQDVEAEVRRRIRDFAPGGGFVFGSVHNIQPDVPPQNVVALFKAACEYGAYPIEIV